jgi:hypothetical protein
MIVSGLAIDVESFCYEAKRNNKTWNRKRGHFCIEEKRQYLVQCTKQVFCLVGAKVESP